MKRRTRLRKQGLPPDPPKNARARPEQPALLDLSRQLIQVLRARTAMSPDRIYAIATDLDVLRDAQALGVETTAACLISCGLTPSELKERVL